MILPLLAPDSLSYPVSICPGVSIAPPSSTSTLLSNHTEASSPHYINPAQPHSPTRGTIELGRILDPGYLGSSGQWDMMRPQKGSVSGELSSGSSMYQLNSKPTGKVQSWDFLSSVRKYMERIQRLYPSNMFYAQNPVTAGRRV